MPTPDSPKEPKDSKEITKVAILGMGTVGSGVAQKEIGREQRDEKTQRHQECPGLGRGKKEGEPRGGMQSGVLLDGEQRFSREHEAIPERQSAVGHGLPDRLVPRDHRRDHVGEQRRARRGGNAVLCFQLRERAAVEEDVERREDSSREHRASREEQWDHGEDERDARPQREHPACGGPERQPRGRCVDRDRRQDR